MAAHSSTNEEPGCSFDLDFDQYVTPGDLILTNSAGTELVPNAAVGEGLSASPTDLPSGELDSLDGRSEGTANTGKQYITPLTDVAETDDFEDNRMLSSPKSVLVPSVNANEESAAEPTATVSGPVPGAEQLPLYGIEVDGERLWLDQRRYTFDPATNTFLKTDWAKRERRAVRLFNRHHIQRRLYSPPPPPPLLQAPLPLPPPPSSPPPQAPLPPLRSLSPALSQTLLPQLPPQSVSPTTPLSANRRTREKGRSWSKEEDKAAIRHMSDIMREGKLHTETRFEEIAMRMLCDGYNREKGAVKNRWNRVLRAESGLDERRKKNQPLATSKQRSKKTQRRQQERQSSQQLASPSKSTTAYDPATIPTTSPAYEPAVIPDNGVGAGASVTIDFNDAEQLDAILSVCPFSPLPLSPLRYTSD